MTTPTAEYLGGLDPVFKHEDKWYFSDETWSDRYGPHDTEEQARTEFAKYCDHLNRPHLVRARVRATHEQPKRRSYVYRIKEGGIVEGLLADKIIDTRIFGGERKIKRVSEILFDETEQKFYIRWLAGPYTFSVVTLGINQEILGTDIPDDQYERNIVWFDTYEQAVDHEIKLVNVLRQSGVSFD